MNPEKVFSFCNLAAMSGWVLLIIAPRWKYTRHIVLSGLLPLILATLYLTLVVVYFNNTEGGFGSLPEVMTLFDNPFAVLTGWVHYLAFDLFVGAWEVEDSRKHGVSHWLVIPCLLLTFMLGPVGMLAYFVIRAIKTKRFVHDNF